MSDYPEETARQQGNSRARRRGVSQDSQHAALSSRRTCTISIRRATRVERTQMEEVDRYILARYARGRAQDPEGVRRRTTTARSSRRVNAFITVDLSAFYADVSKDRLYTFAAGSNERRSAQTAMYVMTDGLTRLLAPILSFSTDELWRYLPGTREESVHLALFPPVSEIEPMIDRSLLDTWEHLLRIRTTVQRITRAAPKGQADRQLAPGDGRPSPHRARIWRCCERTRAICPCCSSCPRSRCGRAVRRRS